MTTPERLVVLVELPEAGAPQSGVLVGAAMQLFEPTDPVDVVLLVTGVDEPDEALGVVVQGLCLAVAGELPETVLLGAAEAHGLAHALHVTGGDDAATARAVVLLAGLAQQLWAPAAAPAPDPSSAVLALRLAARLERATVLERVARRDVTAAVEVRSGSRRPRVVVLVQHRSYWNTLAPVVTALLDHDAVETVVVGLDSTADGREASTVDFLAEQGVEARPAAWLVDRLDSCDLLVLDNPYDELRPAELRVPALAAAGVRTALVPYGCNAIAGELMDALLWDLPLQRLAWRCYVATDAQRVAFARHCATGDEHVRVLGSTKLDRIVAGAPTTGLGQAVRRKAKGRPVVLWNPHFRVGPDGWSTFDTYLEPLLKRVLARRDVLLLVRPHFRLFPDLAQMGGQAAEVEPMLRRLSQTQDSVLLDDSPDYVDALLAADALVSDLSSLAGEFMVTGRPVLYLHRADGPGPGEAGAYFDAMDRATSFADVEAFLARVVRGQDPSRDRRLAAVAEHLGPTDGASGARVAADLVAGLLDELGLSDRAIVVHDARIEGDHLVLDVLAGQESALALGSPTEPGTPVAVPAGRSEVCLPWRRRAWGGPRLPLPTGSHAVSGADLRVGPALRDRLEARSRRDEEASLALRAPLGRALVLEVAPPEPCDDRFGGAVLARTYETVRHRPIEHSVLLSSYDARVAACNPLALSRELSARGHDAVQHWVVHDLSVAVPPGTVPVLRGSAEHYARMATARWVVDNEAMPTWFRKRRGQTVVQTWHGTPLKRLRWDLDDIAPRDPAYMAVADRDVSQWDVVLSANPLTTQVLRRGFRARGEVLESGYPRNDVLADPARRAATAAATRLRLGIAPDAPVVLYAPTWRDDAMVSPAVGSQSYGATWAARPVIDAAAVREAVGNGCVVLYRGHRFVSDTTPRRHDALDVSGYPDMTDLLALADVLVTDYSSSLFDFALTGRPMVFFCYDLERYTSSVRGSYLDVETALPGPVVRTAGEVTAALADLPSLRATWAPALAGFAATYGCWDDGRAAARVVDAVFAA